MVLDLSNMATSLGNVERVATDDLPCKLVKDKPFRFCRHFRRGNEKADKLNHPLCSFLSVHESSLAQEVFRTGGS